MTDWLLSASKYLASFRKRGWELEDYPVRVAYQDGTAGPKAFSGWVAQILKWSLIGTGPTQEAAVNRLRENLAAAKRDGNHPRPGTRPPVTFASADHLEAHGDFAYEFVERVTGKSPMFMSDETSLTDFAGGPELDELRRKIALIYGIEPANMVEGPLWQLLDKVHPQHRAAEHLVAADDTRDG